VHSKKVRKAHDTQKANNDKGRNDSSTNDITRYQLARRESGEDGRGSMHPTVIQTGSEKGRNDQPTGHGQSYSQRHWQPASHKSTGKSQNYFVDR
jgi:hypothetical protein